MKRKIAAIFLIGTMAVAMTACNSARGGSADTADQQTSADAEDNGEVLQIANPWTDCTSLEEAEETAGFDFLLGETILNDTYAASVYRAMAEDTPTIDITYQNDDDELTIRQSEGDVETVNGDYTEYTYEETIDDCGVTYTVYGFEESGPIYLVTFTYQDYAVILYGSEDEGMTADDVAEIISEVTGVE